MSETTTSPTSIQGTAGLFNNYSTSTATVEDLNTAVAAAQVSLTAADGILAEINSGTISPFLVMPTGGTTPLSLADAFANLALLSPSFLNSLSSNQASITGYVAGSPGNGVQPANTIFGLATTGATTGSFNTVFGYGAMSYGSLASPASSNNCCFGFGSGSLLGVYNSVTGSGQNSAFGCGSMTNATSDVFCTGIGSNAGKAFQGSFANTAVGHGALAQSDGPVNGTMPPIGFLTAPGNTAIGVWAQQHNGSTGGGGSFNTSVGVYSLWLNNQGSNNTAVGYNAGQGAWNLNNCTVLGYDALGHQNQNLGPGSSNSFVTAIGVSSFASLTSGTNNVGLGLSTGTLNTTGSQNCFLGDFSGANNTTGGQNVGVGFQTLQLLTTGSSNTAIGFGALQNNTTGSGSTAVGWNALLNASGSANSNTAIGYSALINLTTGAQNDAHGYQAGLNLKTGNSNVYLGYNSGLSNVSATANTALGVNALQNCTTGSNTVVGYNAATALTTGASVTAFGAFAGAGVGANQLSTVDVNCSFFGVLASRDSSIPQTTALSNMTVLGAGATGNASNAVFLGGAGVTQIVMGGITGPQITWGTAAPSTAPPGGAGLYFRIGGAVGSSLYNYAAGAWHAIA